MKRRLFTLLSALSLLLIVAVVVIWVRSYWVEDTLNLGYGSFTSRRGTLIFLRARSEPTDDTTVYAATPVGHTDDGWAIIWSGMSPPYGSGWRMGGFAYGRLSYAHDRYYVLAVPTWAGAVAMFATVGLPLLKRWRKMHRTSGTRCPACGYDLRATPERCPECGTAAWGRAPAGRRTNSWPPRLIGSMLDIEKLRKARAKAGHVMKPPLFAAGVLAALAIGGCAKAPDASPGKNGTVVTGTIGPTVQQCLDSGGTVEAVPECGGQKVRAGRTTPAPTASDLQRLQGTWEGAVVGDRSDDRVTITIAGDSLHFHRDTNFWFKTTFTLPAGTDPQELHATIKDCPPPRDSIGKVVVAFFKVEGGKLTLAAMGERTEEMPKSFEAADDEGWTRYELRKVQPQKENSEPPRTK